MALYVIAEIFREPHERPVAALLARVEALADVRKREMPNIVQKRGELGNREKVEDLGLAYLTVDELLGTKPHPAAQQPPPPSRDARADLLLERLAALSTEPFDRAAPDLIQVLKEAQELAEAARR